MKTTKWEYGIFRIETTDDSKLIFDLNDLGKEGWEAVSTLTDNKMIMKREKNES